MSDKPTLFAARLLRFARSLRLLKKVGWTWRNVKALWIQSRVGWQLDWQMVDATDAEWEAFLTAVGMEREA